MQKKTVCICVGILFILSVFSYSKDVKDSGGDMTVTFVNNPYSGSRSGPELSKGPGVLAQSGIADMLSKMGCSVNPTLTAHLTPEEEKDYGVWHRVGLANGHLKDLVAPNIKEGRFVVGFLANCNSLMGMLAGLQHSGPGRRPLKVGLIWIDAHGDFNTPETTLSGMLGGMPVAVSAGLCLTRLRLKSGLEPALPTTYIVMAGVRDTDPLEQELIDRSDIHLISVDDIRRLSQNIHNQMKRLSRLTDIIYIHIDMDVLDPKEVSGHGLTVADGPSSEELAAALTLMFKYPKAAALGIASYPVAKDKDKLSLNAAYNLVKGAVKGVLER
jgi:arginase